jgi:hypothetical protein
MNAPLVLGASGVPLEGFRLVRVVYLDESGQSSREPRIVQAGVIVHGDSQIVPIEACPKLFWMGPARRDHLRSSTFERSRSYMFDAIPRGDE